MILNEQINSIEEKIQSSIDAKPIIFSISSINFVTAASTFGEINDIDNFDSSSKLLAFLGLDPKVKYLEISMLHLVGYPKKSLPIYIML